MNTLTTSKNIEMNFKINGKAKISCLRHQLYSQFFIVKQQQQYIRAAPSREEIPWLKNLPRGPIVICGSATRPYAAAAAAAIVEQDEASEWETARDEVKEKMIKSAVFIGATSK